MHRLKARNIKNYQWFSAILLSVMMSGCTGARYGMLAQDWQKLNYKEKIQIEKKYNRIAAVRAQEKREQDRHIVTSSTPKLELRIEGGKAWMPPFNRAVAFEPITMRVYDGHCRSVVLKEKSGQRKTDLEACYLNQVLFIDPSRYEFKWHRGSLQFHYNPLWEKEGGFVYEDISSQGYVNFKNTSITVKSFLGDD